MNAGIFSRPVFRVKKEFAYHDRSAPATARCRHDCNSLLPLMFFVMKMARQPRIGLILSRKFSFFRADSHFFALCRAQDVFAEGPRRRFTGACGAVWPKPEAPDR